MTIPSAIQQAVDIAGGCSALARAVGDIKRQHVNSWLRVGRAPAAYCAAIEKATEYTTPLSWRAFIGISGITVSAFAMIAAPMAIAAIVATGQQRSPTEGHWLRAANRVQTGNGTALNEQGPDQGRRTPGAALVSVQRGNPITKR